jgi:hypothetical protein
MTWEPFMTCRGIDLAVLQVAVLLFKKKDREIIRKRERREGIKMMEMRRKE